MKKSIITKLFYSNTCPNCTVAKSAVDGLNDQGLISDYRRFEPGADIDAFQTHNVSGVPSVLVFEVQSGVPVEIARYTGDDQVLSFVQQSQAANCVDGVCAVPGTQSNQNPNTPQTTTNNNGSQVSNNGIFKAINLVPIGFIAWLLLRKK